MKAAEILRQLADIVDKAEQGDTVDQLGRSQGTDGGDPMNSKTMSRMDPVPEPDQDTGDSDKMINPLQQKQELLKKAVGVDNEYDRQDDEAQGCGSEDDDEMDRMKKMVTMIVGGDETDVG